MKVLLSDTLRMDDKPNSDSRVFTVDTSEMKGSLTDRFNYFAEFNPGKRRNKRVLGEDIPDEDWMGARFPTS